MPDFFDSIGWVFEHLVELVGYLISWPIHQLTPF